MTKRHCWIWIFLLWALPLWAQRAYLPHFTTKSGLPGNNCYFALQDKRGFLWISTDAGISRYDGKTFENFTVDDGLPDNQILHLKEDKKGRIWLLSLNGKMSYFYKGRIFNAGNDRLLMHLNFNAAVTSFLEDSKGRIWLGTNKNLIVMWDGQRIRQFVSGQSTAQFINAYIDEDKQGNIWVYSTQAVHKFNGSKFLPQSKSLLPLSYKTIQKTTDGELLFLKADGVYAQRNGLAIRIKKIDPSILKKAPGYFYYEANKVWLSTEKGIYVVDEQELTRHFMPDIPINQSMKDRDGNFWFTSSNGLYLLPEKSERVYIVNETSGLTTNPVRSIVKDKQNRFWLGMDDGIIDVVDTAIQRLRIITFADKQRYNSIKQLEFNNDSTSLYFASAYGLGIIEGIDKADPYIRYLHEEHNSMFAVKNFSVSSSNTLAMALSSGVVIMPYNKNKLSFDASAYRENINFFKDRSYKVFFDNDDQLWFSNINGLSVVSGSKHIRYYLKNSALDKRINDICHLEGGILAMATDGYGILLFHKGVIGKRITRQNGLSSNLVYKLFYRDGFLWAITSLGVNRINLEHSDEDIKTFEYASDLLANGVNDMFIDAKTAYFATNSGLVYFANNTEGGKISPPQVYITGITINEKMVDLQQKSAIIPSGTSNIAFNFTAIDFRNRKLMFRYRLKEDAGWTETRSRRLELSSLEPGTYTFEVAVKSIDGSWGTSEKFNFELERRFWQTAWFWIALSLIGAVLLYRATIMVTNYQRNKEKAQLMMQNKILSLEQQALQALMNPHFIFNVMNSIQHFINTQDKALANKTLTGFARLIRKNLEICTSSYISIAEEIAYLELYLSLEKNRFGDKFSYRIEVAPEIDKDEAMLPSMLLQPFVENAIWHGLMPLESNGSVVIEMRMVQETTLSIRITDNGIGYENSLKHKKQEGHVSKGMQLTRDRIKLLNSIEQNTIQLMVTQPEKGGTVVEILIPEQSIYR